MAFAFLQKFKQQRMHAFSLLFAVGLGLTLAVSACSPSASNTSGTPQTTSPSPVASSTTIRIGYQKASTVLYALKARGELEKTFAASGSSVTWSEFPAGPPLLEALNAGSIDFGYTGDKQNEKVVVHCSGGIGRTGHILAVWLVSVRGLSNQAAIATVKRTGRNPYEAAIAAVFRGRNPLKIVKELEMLLNDCRLAAQKVL